MYTLAHTFEQHCLYLIVLVVRRIEGITIWKSVCAAAFVGGGRRPVAAGRWRPEGIGRWLVVFTAASSVHAFYLSSFCYPPLGLESLTFIHCVSSAELQPFPMVPCLPFLIIKSFFFERLFNSIIGDRRTAAVHLKKKKGETLLLCCCCCCEGDVLQGCCALLVFLLLLLHLLLFALLKTKNKRAEPTNL